MSGESVPADIVIDASGRRSGAARWLREAGYDPPEEVEVDSGMGYGCALYEAPEEVCRCVLGLVAYLGSVGKKYPAFSPAHPPPGLTAAECGAVFHP